MGITYKEGICREEYHKLRVSVQWPELPPEQEQAGLDGSAYIISAYVEGEIAGAARILWDGGYTAYICDVMVAPEYQGQGIGSGMMTRCIEYLKSQMREGWKLMVILVATKDKEGFYEKFGFVYRPNEISGAGMSQWL